MGRRHIHDKRKVMVGSPERITVSTVPAPVRAPSPADGDDEDEDEEEHKGARGE